MLNKANRPPEGTLRKEKVKKTRPKIFRIAQDSKALSKAIDMLLDEVFPPDDPVSQRKRTD